MMYATRCSVGVVLLAASVLALEPEAAAAPVAVARDDAGLTVRASEARLEDVLDALAKEAGFAWTMQVGIERPPVDVDVRGATLEEALRHVLRRRNYTISYEQTENGLEVSRVGVLLPRATEPQIEASRSVRSQAAILAAAQRKQAERQETLRRLERMRANRLRTQHLEQARRARQEEQAAIRAVPLRRMLWSRSY